MSRYFPAVVVAAMLPYASGDVVEINGHAFTLSDGLHIEQIAGQPLVDRPVNADFDENGRLYVTDSSGSNEPVAVQQEKRPHCIRRLEDTDSDGIFDTSTVFADKLMFPEGAQWFDGSLYVAAPPEIWKFTDTNDDGVADLREVWFDGRTLTHCANDLHGPYLGPDGWMYWCKGAFAEQTYERAGKAPLQTSAAHIFRRRPDGGPIEAVMTGGMDNPVEVVFTPGGERIFSTTFLVHPNQGNRDGLIHAVYGGVYGKDHGALGDHPRTGELMPVLAHLGAAAPCGLVRLESNGLGNEFRNNVLACSFNMHKITRHVLTKHGATFSSATTDLVGSNDPDFHPTDVIEDADGSLIVIDTGGWFRLCCPTSQLEKPDVLGGIYRIRRVNADTLDDSRGRNIVWSDLTDDAFVRLLSDRRFTVRNQARQRIGKRGSRMVAALQQILKSSQDAEHRLQCVWALTRIDGQHARAVVRSALHDVDETVRQAALHSISVHRDTPASDDLAAMIETGPAHNRRAAAEALGRVGSARNVTGLLAAVPSAKIHADIGADVDRVLEHSLIYAAMEQNEPDVIRQSISSTNDRIRRAALIALDQLEDGDHLRAQDIQPLLLSENNLLNDTAWWIAEQHPSWGSFVVEAFRIELQHASPESQLLQRLGNRLRNFSGSIEVQQVMAAAMQDKATSESVRLVLLEAMANSRQKPMPQSWTVPVLKQLSGTDPMVSAALKVLNQLSPEKLNTQTIERLSRIAVDESFDAEIRLRSLNLLPVAARMLSSHALDFVCLQLRIESDIRNRALAVDFLTSTPLNSEQLQHIARQLPLTGAMELRPLMALFAGSTDQQVGTVLVASLLDAPAAVSLFPDRLQEVLSGFGEQVTVSAQPLLQRIQLENERKFERVQEILKLLPTADIRRGLSVFQGTKSSCIACHRRGYLGGDIGPDLNRIGQVRSERDLVESILFPSLSFVRSYEPASIVMDSGRLFNGLIRNETQHALTLQIDAQKSVELLKSNIEERQQGTVSIMPEGLEKHLSAQDLADLVRYLKEG